MWSESLEVLNPYEDICVDNICTKNYNRKWWQFWKPKYVWVKKDGENNG